MTDLIILGLVGLMLTAIILYIRSRKKQGATCIGCPDSGHCSGHCSGCCGCQKP